MNADADGNLSRKHLVVFGCGYVGTAVATQALARGLQVTALTRNTDRAVALERAGLNVVVADLVTDRWHEQVPDADLVLNSVSSGGGGPEGYRRSYVDGMRSILAWARVKPVGTMVYTSSTAVYAERPAGNAMPVVDETAETDGAVGTSAILLEAESLLRSPLGFSGTVRSLLRRWFILRVAGIYGPGRHHLLDVVRKGAATISGRGDHHLNLAHRDDIAAAVWAAFDAPDNVANEIFNVADDQAATKREIVAWLAGQTGKIAPAFTGEPGAGRRAVVPDRIISNSKLKKMLGWQPRYPSFREGYTPLIQPETTNEDK